MTGWIMRFETEPVDGRVRVAVKDAIDVAGAITTAGCVAVRDRAVPAVADAACLAGVRAAGAAIVGKTTLTELCVSPAGDNDAFGTPVNPLDPDLVPGGSSSGSAVVVANGEADVGLGTDTAGSVRIPAACCGIAGLKTTWGWISHAGVTPLAPTLDTVGPLARTVADLVTGMRLLAPGFAPAPRPARVVGRVRVDGVRPEVEEAADAALDAAGLVVREVRLAGWDGTYGALDTIILCELWRAHHALLDADGVSDFVNTGLRVGRSVTAGRMAAAMAIREDWRDEVAAVLSDVDLLALPTLVGPPPPLTDFRAFPFTRLTAPFSLAGLPALAMPVPSPGSRVPVSLQLVGARRREDLLCATAAAVEAAHAG